MKPNGTHHVHKTFQEGNRCLPQNVRWLPKCRTRTQSQAVQNGDRRRRFLPNQGQVNIWKYYFILIIIARLVHPTKRITINRFTINQLFINFFKFRLQLWARKLSNSTIKNQNSVNNKIDKHHLRFQFTKGTRCTTTWQTNWQNKPNKHPHKSSTWERRTKAPHNL